jgi:WD40 repeat protein/tetratricopeptide (TPR) repeat protein
MPTTSGSRDHGRFDELAEEFAERYRRGERPSLDEYVDRLPEMADEIREMFPALVEVEELEGEARDDTIQQQAPAAPRLKELGDYRILREVGHGGMGVVYEAEQISLGRHVALKVLPCHVVGDRKALQRFRREAKAAARLHHTNIVPVFEVGQEGDLAFYTMQFIQGQGLDQVIDELVRLRARDRKPVENRRCGSGSLVMPTRTMPSAAAVPAGARNPMLGQVAESLLSGRLATEGLKLFAGAACETMDAAGTEPLDPAATKGAPSRSMGYQLPDPPPPADVSTSALLPGGTAVSMVDSSGRGQPFFRSLAQIGRQAAQGLAYAHSRGIIHRDIKPSNLLLDTAGVVWITDFGLAKAEEDGLTATGDILGTLRYMAPERFRGEGDARADIYALGLTLYELLTLKPAYYTTDRLKLIERINTEEPARPRSMDGRIPRDLETIVLKASDKDPARRYATADAMAEDLRRFLDDEPIQARRASAAERYWRWARRNPLIAVMGGVLTAVLVLATVGSLVAAGRFARLAEDQTAAAIKERLTRLQAERSFVEARNAHKEATDQRNRADHAAEVAQESLYSAQMLLAPQVWRGGHKSLSRMRELLATWLPRGESPDRRGWEWFYLNSLPYQNLRTLTESGSDGRPSTVAWHVASKRLAEGTAEGLIRIWDVDREQMTLILRAPAPALPYSGARWLAWSPDGGKLAAGCSDGTVHLWATPSGRELHVLLEHKSPVYSVAFSSDGTRVAAWGEDGKIKIWDAGTGRLTADVAHPGGVGAGAWSPNDKLLASGHNDGTVTISGIHAGDKIATLRGNFAPVTSLAWSPDSARLAATSSYDFAARIWEVASKKMVLGPLMHSHEVLSVAWEPGGQRLATGSIDESVKIWDATTGREAVTLRGHVQNVTSLAWGPDGRLASGCNDGSVRIWSSIRDQESSVLPGHVGRTHSVSWSPDGKRLASGGDDGKVRIWDTVARKEVLTLNAHDESRVSGQFGLIRSLAWSPDGAHLASAGLDGKAKVWDVAIGREVFALPADHGAVWSVAWSPDGSHLAAASQDGTIRVAEGLKQSPKVHVFQAHKGRVRTLAWNPQGDRLASGGADGLVKLWDPLRGAELSHMQGHQGFVLSVAWSRDGKRLASGATDQLVIAWDAQTRQKLSTMRIHHGWVEAVVWSPDGTRLASAGTDNSVRVSDPQTGHETCVLRGNFGMLHDVSWNPDGARLAAASSDGQIWIWDATRGFERDTTPRALPYIDRAVASGTARGDDQFWYAESYIRAGKPHEALVAVKDDPYGLSKLAGRLDEQENAPLADEARTRARALLERQLAAEPHNAAPASELAELLLVETPAGWTALKPTEMTSEGGATLKLQNDGSILASDTNPDRDVYTLVFRPGLEHISAIRLESLHDPSLPKNGPGRCPNCGNFFLNELRVFSKGKPSVLTSIIAVAPHHSLRDVIDGKVDQSRGWSNGALAGKTNIAIVATRIERASNDDLKIELHFSQLAGGHNLGRFRLFASGDLAIFDRQRHRYSAMKVADPWGKLAAAYQVFGDQRAIAKLAQQHPTAALGIADLYAADQDWDRAIAEYRKLMSDQPTDGSLLTKLAAAYQSAGRTREAVQSLVTASAADPNDTLLSLKVAALQAWFRQDKELAATQQRVLAFAKGTNKATTADRAAKACSLLPSRDKAQLDAALALGRKAVEVNSRWEWGLLALGMAEFRSGNDSAALDALLAATKANPNNSLVIGTSAFYRAMSLFRRGEPDEAKKLAAAAAGKMKPFPKDEMNPLTGDASQDDLILWLAYKEAQSMIKFAAGPPPRGENDQKSSGPAF